MENVLQPHIFDVDPSAADSTKLWAHWLRMFQNFRNTFSPKENFDSLSLLVSFISASVYEYISEYTNYDEALAVLKKLYENPVSEVMARHKLLSRSQEDNESLSQYMNALKSLSENCNFRAITAKTNHDDFIRDAFIKGISSDSIRQSLLGHKTLTLETAYDQAFKLQQNEININSSEIGSSFITPRVRNLPKNNGTMPSNISEDYLANTTTESPYNGRLIGDLTSNFANVNTSSNCSLNCVSNFKYDDTMKALKAVASKSEKCYCCGGDRHEAFTMCPARTATCNTCKLKGHFSKYCFKIIRKAATPVNSLPDINMAHISRLTSSTGNDLSDDLHSSLYDSFNVNDGSNVEMSSNGQGVKGDMSDCAASSRSPENSPSRKIQRIDSSVFQNNSDSEYSCPICGKVFKRIAKIKNHMNFAHNL